MYIALQTTALATIYCNWRLELPTFQMRPTATRQRKVYEESACSTWTERRSSKTTWKIKTSRGRSRLRSHRAMTSKLSLLFSKEGVFLSLEISVSMATSLCLLPAGVIVIVRGKIQRRRNCRSNLWVCQMCTDYLVQVTLYYCHLCRCYCDGEAQCQVERRGWTRRSKGSPEGSCHPPYQIPPPLYR